jgi:hypothetical protein
MLALLFSATGHEVVRQFPKHHKKFWAKIINRAVDAGLLVETTDSVQISHIFDDITRSAQLAWLWRTLDEPQMRIMICYRFLIILSPLTTETGAARLRPMIAELSAMRARQREARRFVLRPRHAW